jgi:hypothetical protein
MTWDPPSTTALSELPPRLARSRGCSGTAPQVGVPHKTYGVPYSTLMFTEGKNKCLSNS